MIKKYTLEEAQNFADNIGKRELTMLFYDFDELTQIGRTLVKKNKDYFNKFITNYLELVEQKVAETGGKKIREAAYKILENLCSTIDNRFKKRKGKAINLFEENLKKIEITHNTQNYSKKEIYNGVNSFIDILTNKYPNLISNPKKEWDNEKDNMTFKFKSRGFDANWDIKLLENELVLKGEFEEDLPLEVKLYRPEVLEKIKRTLDDIFPRVPVFQ